MANEERHGDLVHSDCGKFRDLEHGEKGFHALTVKMLEVEEGTDVAEVDNFNQMVQRRQESSKSN
jgi:hypothetical protein